MTDSISHAEVLEKLRGGAFSSLGILTPEQLLLHLPTGFDDYTNVASRIALPREKQTVSIRVEVCGSPNKEAIDPIRIGVPVTDGVSRARLVAFGTEHPWMHLKEGQSLCINCVVGKFRDDLQLQSPEIIPSEWVGKIMPNYRGKKGKVSQDRVRQYVAVCLDAAIDQAVEFVLRGYGSSREDRLLEDAGIKDFKSLRQLFLTVHRPATMAEALSAMAAIKRLAAFEVVSHANMRKMERPHPKSIISIKQATVAQRIRNQPWPMTAHQDAAINDIVNDLGSPYPMDRLLSGDVGYGKSAVIQVTAMAANDSGAKVAIMTPNTILVQQLAKEFAGLDKQFPILTLTGTDKLKAIEGNPIVIGTTAILSKLKKIGWVPDYLIVDEQEKFSRDQRERLADEHTNIMEATATCQPRTACLVEHGGMDVSILNISPVKKIIESHVVLQSERSRVMEYLPKVVQAGGQVAIVYPLVSTGDDQTADSRKHVGAAYDVWEKIFPGRVGMLHGKMSSDEKIEVVRRMKAREFDVLVASSVVERGITLPDLKAIVVADAWRYGVSQLHQIRGRLARLGGRGRFFMMANGADQDALDRLGMLEQYADGFTLAEKDMEIRGFGDLSDDAVKQHGIGHGLIFGSVKLRPSDLAEFVD